MKIQPTHEDLIYKNREFIQELAKVQDLYFSTLCEEMGLTERGVDWLFDYMFNEHDDCEDFEHHLEKYNCQDQIYQHEN